jgi:hypothetical protein
MQWVRYEDTPIQARGVNHRVGSFRFKDLGQGLAGDPANFYLRMVWSEGDFFSPRHMHNFDQVRVQLKGTFHFDQDGSMAPGAIAYFPEGTPYGPQTSQADTVQLVLQIGGPSGSGYLGEDERVAAAEALAQRGRFANGRYFAAGDTTSTGADGFEALWEFANGRRIRYPARRLERPLMANPRAFDAVPLEGARGVRHKRLWSFGVRTVGLDVYECAAGSQLALQGPLTVFFESGRGELEGCGRRNDFSTYDTLHLARGESARIEAAEPTGLIVFSHPVLDGAACAPTAAIAANTPNLELHP